MAGWGRPWVNQSNSVKLLGVPERHDPVATNLDRLHESAANRANGQEPETPKYP